MLLEIYFEIQLKLCSAIFIMLTFSVTVLQLRGICIPLTKACVHLSNIMPCSPGLYSSMLLTNRLGIPQYLTVLL